MFLSPHDGKSSEVERRASDRKVTDPWFDSRTGNASLCPWERFFTFIFPIVAKQFISVVVAQHEEKLVNKTQESALRWYG